MSQPFDSVAEIVARDDWRRLLTSYSEESAQRLLAAYERLQPSILARIRQLSREIAENSTQGMPSPAEFRALESYQELLAAISGEMADFAVILRNEMADGIDAGILAGLDGAENSVGIFVGGEMPSVWVRPDPAAVRNAIGFVDSVAFRDSIRQFGDNAVRDIADLILSAVAQGRNPNQIARIISDWTSVPLSWAVNMARTSQIWSARLATHSAYTANPNVVTGWMWMSAADQRTCISCWSQHGSIHRNDEILNDHHQGRCTPVPIVRGTRWAESYRTGPDRFMDLDEETQRQIFGNNRLFEAWQNGDVNWTDFSEPYDNAIYGEMLRAASMTSIRSRQR